MWKKIIIDDEVTSYSVSSLGEVRNDIRDSLLTQATSQEYCTVALNICGKAKRMRVHRLVAIAFLPNPDNKPYVNHLNGQRNDNRLENLEWVTPSENSKHAVKTGLNRGNKKPVVQFNLEGIRMFEYESATEASRQTDTPQPKITSCCKRDRLSANDYQWRYIDDCEDVKPLKKLFITGKKVAQCNEEGEVIEIYSSFKEAARAVEGTSSAISRVCSGTNIRHKGFKWKIVDEIVQEDI